MYSDFCTCCYQTYVQPFSCGHAICIRCYIITYKPKIESFLNLCYSQEVSSINTYNLKIQCLNCDLSHPIPGEYLLSVLPQELINQMKPYKNLLILKLDGIDCTVKLSITSQLEVYIQHNLIFTVNTEDLD